MTSPSDSPRFGRVVTAMGLRLKQGGWPMGPSSPELDAPAEKILAEKILAEKILAASGPPIATGHAVG